MPCPGAARAISAKPQGKASSSCSTYPHARSGARSRPLTVVGLGLVAAPANATGGGGDPVPCEPKDAWTETVIITPAVPAVPATPAVPAVTEERMTEPGQPYVAPTEGTPDLWWNWSPNHAQGPQDYVPAFPSDARGTWQGPHENGGPMQDTYGTFQTGGGNSPFFHREEGTEGDPGQPYIAPTYETVVVTPAVPAVPGTPAIPAVTQEVVHPAVTCPPRRRVRRLRGVRAVVGGQPGVADCPRPAWTPTTAPPRRPPARGTSGSSRTTTGSGTPRTSSTSLVCST